MDVADLLLIGSMPSRASGGRPTPEQVRRVWGSFALSPAAGVNSPYQSYKYCAWSESYRKEARQVWREKGIRTVWIGAVIHYQEASFDGRESPASRQHVIDCINELLADGFIPFIQVAEAPVYGSYDDVGIEEFKRDVAKYPEWGWQQAFNGLGIEIWPESDDSTYGYQIVDMARALRPVLPDSFIGVHPGPYGDGLYQGNPYPDFPSFWAAMSPYANALFWQAQQPWFDTPNWRSELFMNATGAVSRIQHEMDRNELAERCKLAGLGTPTQQMIDNLGHVMPTPVRCIYWEGPQFSRPTDAMCDEAARICLIAGCVGTNAGVPLEPQPTVWSTRRPRRP